MKRMFTLIVCIVVVSAICLGASAAIGYVPSKSTADMTQISAPQNSNSSMTVSTVTEESPIYEEAAATCQEEIEKLATSKNVEEYFGAVVDAEGKEVDIKEILGTETVNVYEVCPITVADYKAEDGAVSLQMTFSTPYEEDQEIVVMIGFVTVNADGTKTVTWKAFKGASVAKNGAIEVELDAETLLAIQENYALVAVVSE